MKKNWTKRRKRWEQIKEVYKNRPQAIPMTPDNGRVVPTTPDNSRIMPLTIDDEDRFIIPMLP